MVQADSQAPVDEKMNRILEAAMTVFSRDGFRHATIQDVAQAAGVGKGTIYLYFTSKEELLERMLLSVLQSHRSRIEEVVTGGGTVRVRLERLITVVLEGADRNRERFGFLLHGTAGMGEDFKNKVLNFKSDITGILRSLVEEGIESGEIRPVNPMVLAHLISGTMDSLAAARLWGPKEMSEIPGGADWSGETARLALDCLWRGAAAASPDGGGAGPGHGSSSGGGTGIIDGSA